MTVLFADVVGFTSIAERLDPEDVRALLRPLYTLLRSKIASYGGAIEQFTGDGVMALFGAAIAHGDDAERAVRAALAIREGIVEQNLQNPGRELDVRICVNTGTVMISHNALGRAGELVVAGDAVNVAARLQTAAPLNGVLVGELTCRATRTAIEYRQLEPIVVKGKAEPVKVWEAVAIRSRYERYAHDAFATFVGRKHELSLLNTFLGEMRVAREPRFGIVIGEAGIGKTRLLHELLDQTRRAGATTVWRQGRCLPYGEHSSFGAFAEIVRAQARILRTDPPAEAATKLRADLSHRHADDELEWLEPQLRLLVGLDDELWPEPSTTFAAWRRWIDALADAQPLVLLFEDLQWADEPLLAFLATLDRLHDVPLLVLATTRPELLERSREWAADKTNAFALVLGPLAQEETGALVDSLLHGGAVHGDVHGSIASSSGGNPFFAEEYVRMFLDRGLLRLEDGEWALQPNDEALPVTVQATIAARIDALAPDESALLLDASVIGPAFWVGALERLSKQPRERLKQLLGALEERELVRGKERSTVTGDEEFVFRHALLREVAYSLLPRSRRTAQHRAAAEWLESLPGGRNDLAEARAYHYAEALAYAQQEGTATPDLKDAARRSFRDAGERAARMLAYSRAVDHLERALRLWPADAERPRLLLALGGAKYHHAQGGETELQQAREQLLSAGDLEGVAEACLKLSYLTFAHGRRLESIAVLRDAQHRLAPEPTSATKIRVLATLAGSLSIADQNEEALAIANQAVELADSFGDETLRVRALRNAGTVRTAIGDDSGFAQIGRSIEIARRLNSAQQVPALANLAATWWTRGNLERAWELEAEARSACERFGDDFLLRWLRMKQAREAYWRGSWDTALATVDELLTESAEGYAATLLQIVRGKMRLARGDTAGATAATGAALDAARRSLDSQVFCPALIAHADSLWAVEQRAERDALLEELLTGLTGRESFLGDCWADIAFALVRLGRCTDLRALLDRARLRTRWVEAAEKLCAGDAVAAAAIFAAIGSKPDEALAHLLAAEQLAALHAFENAERELKLARAFFARVGAAGYAARADAIGLVRVS